MPNILLISGSPRKGNTEFVLNSVFRTLKCNKEMIYLRDKHIEPCTGCLGCRVSQKCSINDDMQKIYPNLLNADIIVIASPNYFENISGLLKNFIDRTHPLYESQSLKEKQILLIMTGGGKKSDSMSAMEYAMHGFIKHQKLKLIGNYAFQALEIEDIAKDKENVAVIKEIITKVNSF